MARRRASNVHIGAFSLALVLALFIWLAAHGSSSTQRGFDLPVVLRSLEDSLVVTDRSVDVVNIRVMGSHAALRNLSPDELEYNLDVSGAKPGEAEFEVDLSEFEQKLPRGARIVSRSPSLIQLRFERSGRKSVGVRADLEGDLPAGYRLIGVELEPPRVWLAGARSQVLRLREVVTEPIDLSALTESQSREVRLLLGGGTVWMEEPKPVTVRINIEAEPDPEVDPEAQAGGDADGSRGRG
ncbi:MAG: CdaR family protein [Proteobacteria bacterium]|nr:CdaR family protein [Pseudomonadota bacterium]